MDDLSKAEQCYRKRKLFGSKPKRHPVRMLLLICLLFLLAAIALEGNDISWLFEIEYDL